MIALQEMNLGRGHRRPPIQTAVGANSYDYMPKSANFNDNAFLSWIPRSIALELFATDLIQKAQWDALLGRVTASPAPYFCNVDRYNAESEFSARDRATSAQSMATEIKQCSGLTNEEIAPLLGVSRRSLQSWIAGEAISARNESRLRAVLDTVRSLAANDADGTRSRLMNRKPHSVSPYDLIAEKQYEAAIDIALNRSRQLPLQKHSGGESLVDQLSHVEENVAALEPRLNTQLSVLLRR